MTGASAARYRFAMRVCAALALGTLGVLLGAGAGRAAELTDVASSFEPGKPFGFRLSAGYRFTYKTASITRESLPQLQSGVARGDLLNHYKVGAGQTLGRTEIVPDLLYTQQRHAMELRSDIGIFRDLQLSVAVPLYLQDVRTFELDPKAGWNQCNLGSWGCIASSSSTVLDGIYPVEPADQAGALLFRPPYRGGGGLDLLDTVNISLAGAPVSQRRDPSKPTWVIGFEAQVSVGTIMQYDNTRLRLPADSHLAMQSALDAPAAQQGWNGVSEGLHRMVASTALSHRFRHIDPYFGLWYLYPIARQGGDSPWKAYGFQQKRGQPQQQAGVRFGFEATPLEDKARGHRLALDVRGGLSFHFLGRGYSEAWELFASSDALLCDDQTALPPPFNFKDADPRPGVREVTQGTFNPACRAPRSEMIAGDKRSARLGTPSPYYQHPYSGLTVIDNYLTLTTEIGLSVELYRHLRLRLAFEYLRDQGHLITADDAGTISYANRDAMNGRTCNAGRIDLACPNDWNPAYRAVIDQPGRRYRVDDVNQFSGSAMAQLYF